MGKLKICQAGILTDGNEFQFYTDARNPGQMDVSPSLRIMKRNTWSARFCRVREEEQNVPWGQ